MKVGIEVQRLFRKNKHGMEIVALELLREIDALSPLEGLEFVVFTKDDVDNQCLGPLKHLKVVTVPGRTYIDWEQFHLPRALRAEGIDLLHCTCNTAPRNPGVPFILTLHDLIYMERSFKGSAYQYFGNMYRRWLVPGIAGKARQIITVSEFEKRNISDRLNIDPSGVDVIYNAVKKECHLVHDPLELSAFREEKGLPERFLLFLGNQAARKNMAGVLEAYALYAGNDEEHLPLVILNFKRESLPQEFRDRNDLILFDYVTEYGINMMYNLATIFLYPSFREGFGMPVLEAMACGTPVITSNTSSMPEVAGGHALLVDPNKPADIADKVNVLLSDTALYEERRNGGLEHVKKFSWRHSALKLVETYKRFG